MFQGQGRAEGPPIALVRSPVKQAVTTSPRAPPTMCHWYPTVCRISFIPAGFVLCSPALAASCPFADIDNPCHKWQSFGSISTQALMDLPDHGAGQRPLRPCQENLLTGKEQLLLPKCGSELVDVKHLDTVPAEGTSGLRHQNR